MCGDCRDCKYRIKPEDVPPGICVYDYCSLTGDTIVDLDDSCSSWRAKHPTNADRIRAMTDEKLADFLDNVNYPYSYEEWLEWLKQEVSDA